ncbi:DUF6932 family protein [Bradyrhizobium septentrionale]|uniref:DUF6932 family protein n=1 Tax=Bradyrhizobium septentrionale TaxID=1404411 RepID=UPI003B8A8E69
MVVIRRVRGGSRIVPLKFDHPPLLAPGRHYLSLQQIEILCVHPFTGYARSRREQLFYALEDVIQQLLIVKLPCEVFVDGSFFTEKPDPGDVDCLVAVEYSVMKILTPEQRTLIDGLNQEVYVAGVDSLAVTKYPPSGPSIFWIGPRRRERRRSLRT